MTRKEEVKDVDKVMVKGRRIAREAAELAYSRDSKRAMKLGIV